MEDKLQMTAPTAPIYLLADSQLLYWHKDNRAFIHGVLEQIDTTRPRAAYVGASNGDQSDYFQIFRGAMGFVGVTDCRMIRSAYSDDDRDYLSHADIILLAGGDAAQGLKIMNETGMIQDIRLKYYHDHATLIGVSAGAVQLGITARNAEGDRDLASPGLGLVPYVVDVHDEANGWNRLRKLVEHSQVQGLALPTGGGIVYHPDETLEPVRYSVLAFYASVTGIAESLLSPLDLWAEDLETRR